MKEGLKASKEKSTTEQCESDDEMEASSDDEEDEEEGNASGDDKDESGEEENEEEDYSHLYVMKQDSKEVAERLKTSEEAEKEASTGFISLGHIEVKNNDLDSNTKGISKVYTETSEPKVVFIRQGWPNYC